LADTLITQFTDATFWAPRDGAIPLLEALKDSPITLGVVSNFDPRLHSILDACKLSGYFKFVLTSYEAGCSKPDPEIFQKALHLAALDGLEPQHALHVGDNLDLDVKGAQEAGWQAWMVDDKRRSADKLKGSLEDLKGFLTQSAPSEQNK
jgi:putative hydrolase of the HAD superfamily